MRLLILLTAATWPLLGICGETDPWGSRDFTFKRIGAGQTAKGTSLVQIDPTEEPYFLTPPKGSGSIDSNESSNPPSSTDGTASWFWSDISTSIGAGSPFRIERAVGQLSAGSEDLAPGWGTMAKIIDAHGSLLNNAAEDSRVSAALALAVMSVESHGRTDAVSSAGAKGLMQLMPATAARFNVEDPFEPAENIKGGVSYLDFLLRTFGEDPLLSIAAYNAGEGAIAKHKGIPPYAETRNYVPKVVSAWARARMFCETPPKMVTDPCQFKGTGG